MIDADRKDDFRYSKRYDRISSNFYYYILLENIFFSIKQRSKANAIEDIQSTLVLEQLIDPMYDSETNVEELLKANPFLMQIFADKFSKYIINNI